MFIDLASDRLADPIRSDVLVVGSGPAGITIARRLAAQGRKITILESGGLEFSTGAQQLNRGGDAWGRKDYLETSRIRAFGGTSFHWGGWCRPLDDSDFAKRDWISDSGWPILAQSLASYYVEATKILDLDAARFDAQFWVQERGQPTLKFDNDDFFASYFQLSPPTRFGKKYREEISQSVSIKTILNATVTEIKLNESGTACIGLTARGPDGKPIAASANLYVLACGGIENARLLLLQSQTAPNGVGNRNGLVGRYFMDHMAFNSGTIVPTSPELDLGLYVYDSHPTYRGFATVAPSVNLARRLRSLNFNIELQPRYDGLGNSEDTLKDSYWALANDVKKRGVFADFGRRLGYVYSMIGSGGRYAISKIMRGRPKLTQVNLRHHLECTPKADSRVTLDRVDRDRFGNPLPFLDWRVTKAELEGWHRGLEALGLALGRSNLGRLQIKQQSLSSPQDVGIESSWHHIGTTRMGTDPTVGVVDTDCRVHGISNLYVAGSSVFPTCGHANPTLTIVALALRLADHVGHKAG